jgi:hypothetical protein
MTWTRQLSNTIVTTAGDRIATLGDARGYLLSLDDTTLLRSHWQNAVEHLHATAQRGGSVEAVTQQLTLALLIDGKLDIGETWR